MGKTKYRIVEETRVNQFGTIYTMYRVKKKIMNLFWLDIGGGWSIDSAKRLIDKDGHPKPLPVDKIIAEYEL